MGERVRHTEWKITAVFLSCVSSQGMLQCSPALHRMRECKAPEGKTLPEIELNSH